MLLHQIEDKDKGSFSTDDLLQANGKRKRESSESSSEVSVEEDKVSISVGEDNSPTTNAWQNDSNENDDLLNEILAESWPTAPKRVEYILTHINCYYKLVI